MFHVKPDDNGVYRSNPCCVLLPGLSTVRAEECRTNAGRMTIGFTGFFNHPLMLREKGNVRSAPGTNAKRMRWTWRSNGR